MAFVLLCVGMVILWAAVSVAIGVVITVYLEVRGLCLFLLLVTLRRWTFRFLVVKITETSALDLASLPVGRTPPVQRSGSAVSAIMFEFVVQRLFSATGIEAFDMLPRTASFAEYRTSIIVVEATDTLDDGVIYGLGRRGRIVGNRSRRGIEGGLNRSRDLRGYREGPFCHNLAGASWWLFVMERGLGEFTDSWV